MAISFNSIPTKRLAITIDGSATSFKINDILGWDGVALTSSIIGDKVYATFRNAEGTVLEITEIDPTTIANNSSTGITFLKRGLKFNGDLTTQVTGNKLTWVKNETIVELGSNPPQLLSYLKNYIDTGLNAGAADGSTTIKGLFQEATQVEIDADTGVGSTLARLAVNPSTLATSKYGVRLPSLGEKAAMAGGGSLGTPSSTNKFLTEDFVAASYMFGDGSDGDVTISTPTTLSRDMYYNNLTVTSTLNTGGWRIFVKGTLTGAGNISANGNNGSNGGDGSTAPVEGAGGAGGAATVGYFSSVAGSNGQGGVFGGAAGIAGANKSNVPTGGANGAAGGGATGYPTSNTFNGGAGGTATITRFPVPSPWQILGMLDVTSTGATVKFNPAAGAGSGANGATQGGNRGSGGGGGGGASGNILFIAARNWNGTFGINAIGGNGGNGGSGVGASGVYTGGGAGAGGAGGITIVIYLSKTWNGSYNVSGGIGGTGGGGSISGGNASNGASGTSYEFYAAKLI